MSSAPVRLAAAIGGAGADNRGVSPAVHSPVGDQPANRHAGATDSVADLLARARRMS